MTLRIEKIAAKGVFDPPAYAQAIKVTGAQTILFISGQVDYDDKGQPGHPGDFAAQARATFSALKAQVEAAGGTLENIVKLTTFPCGHSPPQRSGARTPRVLWRQGSCFHLSRSDCAGHAGLADRGRGHSSHLAETGALVTVRRSSRSCPNDDEAPSA